MSKEKSPDHRCLDGWTWFLCYTPAMRTNAHEHVTLMILALASVLAMAAPGCGGATTPVAGSPEPAVALHALVGATLLDGTGAAPVADAAVIIQGDRVACAGSRSACPIPAGAVVVDVSGQWITPGLIDTHVHFSQTAWVDGRPDFVDLRDRHPYDTVQANLRANPERFYQSFLCAGVTAVVRRGRISLDLGYPGDGRA